MTKPTILLVDDEPNIVSSLKRLLRKDNYNILTANSGKEGLDILKDTEEIALIISDQRMPEMTGIDFLQKVKNLYPDIIRVILSGYTEVNTIVSAINEGEIYKFITKPWNDEEIRVSIKRALEQHALLKENKELFKKVTEQNEKLAEMVQKLERVAEERTPDIGIHNKTLQLSQNIVENLPMGIAGIDENGNIVMGNRKIHEDFGIEPGNMIGHNTQKVFPEQITKMIEDSFHSNERKMIAEYKHSGAKGEKTFLIECYPVTGKDEERGTVLLTRYVD